MFAKLKALWQFIQRHVHIEIFCNNLYGFKGFIAVSVLCHFISLLMHNYNIVIIFIGIQVQPPTNVRVIVVGPRSVEVTWDPSLSPGITSYLISYTTTASYTSGGSVSVNGITISSILTNLEENTLYTVTVQATNSSGTSGNSNEVSVTTYTDGK